MTLGIAVFATVPMNSSEVAWRSHLHINMRRGGSESNCEPVSHEMSER